MTHSLLLVKFAAHYNTTRSSMVRDHLPPVYDELREVTSLKHDQVEVWSHVGVLDKSFIRRLAEGLRIALLENSQVRSCAHHAPGQLRGIYCATKFV